MSYTVKALDNLKERATAIAKENEAYLKKLMRQKPKQLDNKIRSLHNEEFECIDCLECANCCKTLSPIIYEADINRMASAEKMKVSDFKDKYLDIDEDGDYVFRESPCPFLDYENYCLIYENRPKACREYPHTDRKRFYQVALKTYRNSFTCPAVFNIIQKLKEFLP